MSSRWCESQAVRLKPAGLPDGEANSVRNYGDGDHRPPSQSSKTVLSTVHVRGAKERGPMPPLPWTPVTDFGSTLCLRVHAEQKDSEPQCPPATKAMDKSNEENRDRGQVFGLR